LLETATICSRRGIDRVSKVTRGGGESCWIELAGPLPADIQLCTVFAAATSPISKSSTVRALLGTLVSPNNVLKATGREPEF